MREVLVVFPGGSAGPAVTATKFFLRTSKSLPSSARIGGMVLVGRSQVRMKKAPLSCHSP